MNILALDTSSDACSAALLMDGVCHAELVVEPRAHTRLILPMVDQVLAQGGIGLNAVDALAFGRGPGAFTGVRIATGVVQGLALAADKPVVPVSTLAAIAQQAYLQQQATHVLVAVDARMSEVYWGRYELVDGIMQVQDEEQVIAPEDVPVPESGGQWLGAGSGWREYADILKSCLAGCVGEINPDYLPAAEYIAHLAAVAYQKGEVVDPELAQPVYLRNKVAETTRERAMKI
ncbi:MAG: tRNA (adenosine(37)-N6)-threonylcarbamoyltransferase complex dimerization subunit type 1 TsaB [Thiotrichales bacterium]|nr:MAG: tRNA (adenosine(37)-N6)-threonylcarbamoyltransferase complex dimerization subunit type 1 TsaB [Thiotrichales bacterium]